MPPRPSELQTTRGRVFFWTGLVLLPVFWVWWMRPARFSRTQRRAAWGWTACYVAVLAFFHMALGGHLQAVQFGYPVVAARVALALWVWLAFRLFDVRRALFGFIVLMDALAISISVAQPAWVGASMGMSPLSLLFPLLPATLHLLLQPLRRWRRNAAVIFWDWEEE